MAATTAAGVAAGGLGLAASIPSAAAALYRAWQESQDERIRRLLDEAYLEQAADEGFAAHIAALLQNARTRRLFLESVHAAVAAVSDQVLPAIAALMRSYERTGTTPDGDFRNLCELLQSLSSEEYQSFRALFLTAVADRDVVGADLVAFGRVRRTNEPEEVSAVGITLRDGSLHQNRVMGCSPPHFARLSHLLYIHGIGDKLGFGAIAMNDSEIFDEVRVSPARVRWVAGFLVK